MANLKPFALPYLQDAEAIDAKKREVVNNRDEICKMTRFKRLQFHVKNNSNINSAIGNNQDFVISTPRVVCDKHYIKVTRKVQIPKIQLQGTNRQAVKKLSHPSRVRMIQYLDGLEGFTPHYMLTLTYEKCFPWNGKVVKRHLNDFFDKIVGNHGYRGIDSNAKMFWKMEFQKRGAPHFHILLDCSYPYEDLKHWCLKEWGKTIKAVKKASTSIEYIRDDQGCAIYISLHTAKEDQNRPPEGYKNPGRFWGCKGIKATYPHRNVTYLTENEANEIHSKIVESKLKYISKELKARRALIKTSPGTLLIDKDPEIIKLYTSIIDDFNKI